MQHGSVVSAVPAPKQDLSRAREMLLLLLETSEVGGRSIKALAPPQLHTERVRGFLASALCLSSLLKVQTSLQVQPGRCCIFSLGGGTGVYPKMLHNFF